jgi:hypothetical protein
MSKNEEFKVNTARDALALLTHKMYARYGRQALDIIGDVWHKLGQSIGEGMKRNLPDTRLVTAGQSFVGSGRKRGTKIDVLELNEKKLHIKGYRCALGLEGKGRDLCLACMECDKGIFEAATGSPLTMDIITTVADNADCCEVIFELK